MCIGISIKAETSLSLEPKSENLTSHAVYGIIAERNVFSLRPAASMESPSVALARVPKQDLVLTGLADLNSTRCAIFMVMEPPKAPFYFTLHDGQGNEWLEIRVIDAAKSAVVAVLKRPIMRFRKTGVEVLLSMQTSGINNVPAMFQNVSTSPADVPPQGDYAPAKGAMYSDERE